MRLLPEWYDIDNSEDLDLLVDELKRDSRHALTAHHTFEFLKSRSLL